MMDDGFLTVPATVVNQHDKDMYIFAIDGHSLFQFCTVSRREEDKELGYQRNLRLPRARSIASYIDAQSGLIPNNIIINFDKSVTYENGHLLIPDAPDAAWVIDGQHRLWGIHLANSDVQVCVVAFIDLPIEEQVALFIKINSTQKGVPSSLYLDLLEIMGDEESLDRRIRDIVAQLDSEEDSPWYGNINMTGEGKGSISLANFARKLRPLVEPQRGALRMYTLEEQYRILLNYFDGIKNVFYDQWNSSSSKLVKTVGFGALMNALPDVLNLTLQKYNGFTPANVRDIFRPVADIKFDSATLGSGTGNKAETEAGKIIVSRLTEAIRESEEQASLIRLVD